MKTPVHAHIQRTLAAIVVTDAVGFSKHMSQDEDKALSMINRDLQLVAELCEFFDGKILKTVGDGVLMYFVSAIQAAACAVEMQKTFAGFASDGQAKDHFTHRVGVHLGDIFFNQTDMMGTGVNIAARLESEARPGAICMSQVVYDMVKSRLEIDAKYAGELRLKNIEDPIAAYQVWPAGLQPHDTESGVTTEAVAPLFMTPLNAALKHLTEHPNSHRIKKLLYGVHQSAWENDAAVLESVPTRMLLESLTDRNATFAECRSSLYNIVQTLNRQTEYTQVADVILDQLRSFYTQPATVSIANAKVSDSNAERKDTTSERKNTTKDTTKAPINEQRIAADAYGLEKTSYGEDDYSVGSLVVENPMEALYMDVAAHLDATTDAMRMKKMLYCLCYDRWENDGNRLTTVGTASLIAELYRQVNTIQGLQNRLRSILMRLNRKAKYTPIANLIFDECKILYPEGDSQVSQPGVVGVDDSSGENTQINVASKKQSWTSQTPRQVTQQTKSMTASNIPFPA